MCQCVCGRERDLQMAEFQSQMQPLISFYSNAAFTELIFRSLCFSFCRRFEDYTCIFVDFVFILFHLSFFLGFYHRSAFRIPHLLFSIHVMLILETQRGEVMLAALFSFSCYKTYLTEGKYNSKNIQILSRSNLKEKIQKTAWPMSS